MKSVFKIKGVKYIVWLSLMITLTGCSLLPELPSFSFGEDEPPALEQTVQSNNLKQLSKNMSSDTNTNNNKYEEHLLEWQQAKDNMNKVTNLAGQVTTLTAKIKSLETTQAKLKQELSNVTKSNTPRANYSKKPQSATNNMEGYAIQLFSVPQKSQIQPSWDKAMKMHPNELSGLKRIYEQVTVSNRLYYRVKAGVFNSKSQAAKLCSKIKSAGSVCIPTLFKGQSF